MFLFIVDRICCFEQLMKMFKNVYNVLHKFKELQLLYLRI